MLKPILTSAVRELYLYGNREDVTKVLPSFLRTHPSVIQVVRNHLTSLQIVERNNNDIVFSVGRGHCDWDSNLLEQCRGSISKKDMIEGDNAREAAVDLLLRISKLKPAGRPLINTPAGLVVEDDQAAIDRVARRLKTQQYHDQHYAERRARETLKRQVIRLEEMQEKAKQNMILARLQIEQGQLTDSNCHEFLLSLTYDEKIMDANPLLKAGAPAMHGSVKNPFGPSWQRDEQGRPKLMANARLPVEKQGESGRTPRDLEDNRNWFSTDVVRVKNHLSIHNKHNIKDGSEMHLLGFTSVNEHHASFHQFKVVNDNGFASIFPSTRLFAISHTDPVPCFVAHLKFKSNMLDNSTVITITWLNGVKLDPPIDARDEGFIITESKTISHPRAPLL